MRRTFESILFDRAILRIHQGSRNPRVLTDSAWCVLAEITLIEHTHYTHMSTKRAHVLLPEDLLREIDSLVGPRGRSSFLAETARQEVRRQKLLHFLESKDTAWKDRDHPELADNASAWVQRLRTQSEGRRPSRRPPKKRARTESSRTQIES